MVRHNFSIDTYRRQRLLLIAVGFFILSGALSFQSVQAASSGDIINCVLKNLAHQPASQLRSIETIDDLLLAFSEGLEPDLTKPGQREAFQLYLNLRFGDPHTNLNADTFEQLGLALGRYPELQKRRFRNIDVKVQARSYPTPARLAQIMESEIKAAGKIRGNLFQVEANSGYWKKILQYQEPPEFSIKLADKDASKQLQKKAQEHFKTFLNQRLPKQSRDYFSNSDAPMKERAKALYEILSQERLRLEKAGQDTAPVSQSIVDLIHIVGFSDPHLLPALKSSDGFERLNAYYSILDQRDSFALELFNKHFDEVLKELRVNQPTGQANAKGFGQELKQLQAEMMTLAKSVAGATNEKTIRHLSLFESPFRSCLGGSDCSSRTYLTRALDPNYHYFTFTDPHGFSSGHMTVVLGEVEIDGKLVKAAFVDKVQNIATSDIPIMFEGVRQSMSEQGYLLVLPKVMGGHEGMSNMPGISNFIEHHIQLDQSQLVSNFKPHQHEYVFANKFSRVDENLPMGIVSPQSNMPGVGFAQGKIHQPWKAGNINIDKLAEASWALKDGNVESKSRYLYAMKIIAKISKKIDPEYLHVTELWLKDHDLPFKLRKQVFMDRWNDGSRGLHEILALFPAPERADLLQLILDNKIQRSSLLNGPERKFIPEILLSIKGQTKTRDRMIALYAPSAFKQQLLTKILNSTAEIGDARALKAMGEMHQVFNSNDVTMAAKLINTLGDSKLGAWMMDQLVDYYHQKSYTWSYLSQNLNKSLDSPLPDMERFGELLLARAKAHPRHADLIHSYLEIKQLRSKHPLMTMDEASDLWLSQAQVSVDKKAQYMEAMRGRDQKRFERMKSKLPADQVEAVLGQIGLQADTDIFAKLAKQNGYDPDLVDHGIIDSFKFSDKSLVKGSAKGAQLQLTPVTELQWALTMGPQANKVANNGTIIQLGNEYFKLGLNRPMTNITLKDIREFINKLNSVQTKYSYRLPTEAEWELALKSQANAQIDDYAWNVNNSDQFIHPVADLLPNPDGVFDLLGNLKQWTYNPGEGDQYKMRGFGVNTARPVDQQWLTPGSDGLVYGDVGFRLVREPRP